MPAPSPGYTHSPMGMPSANQYPGHAPLGFAVNMLKIYLLHTYTRDDTCIYRYIL